MSNVIIFKGWFYNAKIAEISKRKLHLEDSLMAINERETKRLSDTNALIYMKDFCKAMSIGLDYLDFKGRQQLLQMLIERITIENSKVAIDVMFPAKLMGNEAVQLRPCPQNPTLYAVGVS